MVDQGEIGARVADVNAWYGAYFWKCRHFEERFVAHLAKSLKQAGVVDVKLESRTKSVESMVAKSVKQTSAGEFKYADPQTEITDLVGARVEVPLSTDLPAVVRALNSTYAITEELEKGSDQSIDIPGYRSLHFLVRVRQDDPDYRELSEFADMIVEVQVRTTLQHAWASLQHDLMYKTERAPTPAVKRRLVALAGLLELADREFVSVRQAHSEIADAAPPDVATAPGALSASGLRHLAEQIFGEEDVSSQSWYVELKSSFDKLGLASGAELDSLILDWRPRAPEVAAVVRRTKPWVNLAYLLDLLVRLAMRERYVELIPPDDEDEATEDEMRMLRESFLAELVEIDQALSS